MNADINKTIIEIDDNILGKVEIGFITHDTNYNDIAIKILKKPYFIKNNIDFNYRDQTMVEAIYNCLQELSSKVDDELYGDYDFYDKICRGIIKLNLTELLDYRPKHNSKIRVLYSISQNDCTIHLIGDSLEIKGKGVCFFNGNKSRIFCNGKIGRSDTWWKGDLGFIISSYFENVFNKDGEEKTTDDYRVFFELVNYDNEIEEETFYIKNTNQEIRETPSNRDGAKNIIMLHNYFPSTSISISDICDAKSFFQYLPTINQNGTKYCRMLFLSKNNSGKSLK